MVDRMNVHHGAEDPRGHRHDSGQQGIKKRIELPGPAGLLGVGKIGATALFNVRSQSELRNGKDLALNLLNAQVHLVKAIGKDPQVKDFIGHECNFFFSIPLFDADQQQQPRSDPADRAAADLDAGPGNPLQNYAHGVHSGFQPEPGASSFFSTL
jgi:hypothetical protein